MKKTLSRQRGGTLLGVFVGLVVGVLIAFGVVWYMNKANLPFQDKAPPVERREAPGAAAAPLPGKPGDKVGVGEKPRFEFYKMLPAGQEEGGGKPATPAPAPQEAAKPAAEPAHHLQAGAFQKAADAENMKAKLAMLGVESGIQEASVPDKGTVYRVRIGPLPAAEMNRVKNLLSQNGIQATPVKNP